MSTELNAFARSRLLCGIAAGIMAFGASGTPASAQRNDDVIVMRRVIAPIKGRPSPVVPPTSMPAVYKWMAGDWSGWSSSCSTASQRTRTVDCTMNGINQADRSRCIAGDGAEPAAVQTMEITTSCGYTVVYGAWGACQAQPNGGGVRNRQMASCLRSDGVTVANAACGTPELTGSCTPQIYAWSVGGWSDWSSTCSSGAKRNRTVECTLNGVHEDDKARCVEAKGAEPGATETAAIVTSCSYTPVYGEWGTCQPQPDGSGTMTRELASCLRSDGVTVGTGECTAPVLTSTCTPVTPSELVVNGNFTSNNLAGWTLTGTMRTYCNGSSCYIQGTSNGSSATYITPYRSVSGATYRLAFTYGNLSVTGNKANSTWRLESNGATVLSGSISDTNSLGSVKNFGTFVGTGHPVTLVVTRTRSDSNTVAYDAFSILKQ